MTDIVIIGASNEDDRGTGIQLGEALKSILPNTVLIGNYAVGGCVTADFVRQADRARVDSDNLYREPDAVIIGLSNELLLKRKTAIDLLRNVVRVYYRFTDSQILVQKYPDNILDVINPKLIQRPRDFEIGNMEGYNRSLDNHARTIRHVNTLEWPEYYTDWYLTGRSHEDPIHATAAQQVAMACRVVTRLRELGVQV